MPTNRPQGLLPPGGTTGQIPKKNSNTSFDYSWSADTGGGGEGVEGFIDANGDLIVDTESSAAAQSLSTGGTVTLGTVGDTVFPITLSGAVTGIILPAGLFAGQYIHLINRSTTTGQTITFAADATSRVAGGTANVIPITRSMSFVWDVDFAGTGTGRWVRHADETGGTVTRYTERPFYFSGALTVKTGVGRYPVMQSETIVDVRAHINTAPTGASVIVDVNKGGTTIYGTQGYRPTIAVSTNAATGGAASVTSLAAGDYITVDIDQIGSTVAGSDLTVIVRSSY